MKLIRLFGDSILKGVVVSSQTKSYKVDNNMGLSDLESRFGVSIMNSSRFGMTVTKGFEQIRRDLENSQEKPDLVCMDYGGNDADFYWSQISEDPYKDHQSKTSPEEFVLCYSSILDYLEERSIRPIIFSLPPIDSQRYFDWFTQRDIDKSCIMEFLHNDVQRIYRYQELFSRMAEDLAKRRGCVLVDIRSAFLQSMDLGSLLCVDGIHPNLQGQLIIGRCMKEAMEKSLKPVA